MTIERKGGDIVFVCDTCEAELETHSDVWRDALALAKREGWASEQVGKDWVHGCDKCGT